MKPEKIIKQSVLLSGLLLFVACKQAEHPTTQAEWRVYGGSSENTRYSSLTQIDTSNIGKLQVAWVYNTGDADSINHSQIQCNPIMVDGVLYATSPRLKLLALDAATGKLKWTFNPADSNQNKSFSDFIMNNNRGVTYWQEGDDKRIFYVAGSILYAINASTGNLIGNFGTDGRVDLHEDLGMDAKDLYVAATSPGIIYKDLFIIGSRVSEGSDAAPGHIRAFDARTGKQRWIFHTIPHPGEYGYDSWEDSLAYKHIGGANSWSGLSLDEKRGILFASTGSASYDFYGGRRKGSGLFANCLLALDASSGKRIWHFQTVHHDVWDKDLPTAPALVTVMHNGKNIEAVAQPTKTGFVFLFDRESGNPLFPIEERPVPTNSELKGEQIWPTQPFPSLPKPFARQAFTENDLNRLLPDSSYQDIRKKFASYKSGNMFMPPSREGTVILPGYDGGAEWGGPSFDPSTGILYVNANEMAWVLTMIDAPRPGAKSENYGDAGTRLYQQNCLSCHGPNLQGSGNYPAIRDIKKKYTAEQLTTLISTGRRMMPSFQRLKSEEKKAIASFLLHDRKQQAMKFIVPRQPVDTFRTLPFTNTGYNKFLSKEGYPALSPPWGTLNAINLNTGEIAWTVPLGEYPEFKARGIITGTENYGGSIVTRGGLLIIAATRDSKLRIFHKNTGALLWETILPAPGFATPATYSVNGKQYIVIACGGGKLGTRSGDAYMAFALP